LELRASVADHGSALPDDEGTHDLLAGLAHELLTPLTSVVGYTELLLESTTLTEEDRRCLEAVQRRGDELSRRLQMLIEELPTIVLDGAALEELVSRISRL
jgi:signal transduction histidine kinase